MGQLGFYYLPQVYLEDSWHWPVGLNLDIIMVQM